jgi:hypothetical protein
MTETEIRKKTRILRTTVIKRLYSPPVNRKAKRVERMVDGRWRAK